MMVRGSSRQPLCLFIFGWRWGGGGGGGWGVMMNETSCTSNGGSDQCHPIVLLWQSGRIAVSLPAQWQTRLSWEWREALFCHAKSLKPSSFRLGNPQYCVTASAAERWQSQSQRTHGPGSLELRRATAPRQGEAQRLFLILCEKDLKPGIKRSFLILSALSHSIRTWPFAQCHHDHLLVAQCTAVSLLSTDLPDPDEWQLPVSLSQLTESLINCRESARAQPHNTKTHWFGFAPVQLPTGHRAIFSFSQSLNPVFWGDEFL